MIRTAGKTWKPGKRKTGKWKTGKWKIECLETKTPQTFALGLIIIDHYIMIQPESTTSIDHNSHEDYEDYEDGRNVQSARLRNHV